MTDTRLSLPAISSDVSVKGDSQIVARGAEGILAKEMERQSAMEILQVVGSVGAQLGQLVNIAPVVQWSLQKLMGTMGVPDDILNQMGQSMMPQGVGPMAGALAGSDNPNPAPPSPTGAGVAADISGGGM